MPDSIRSFTVLENTADCTIIDGQISLISYRGIHLTLEEIEDLSAGVSEILVTLDTDITRAFGDDDDERGAAYQGWFDDGGA